jgi:hypothetical protein
MFLKCTKFIIWRFQYSFISAQLQQGSERWKIPELIFSDALMANRLDAGSNAATSVADYCTSTYSTGAGNFHGVS